MFIFTTETTENTEGFNHEDHKAHEERVRGDMITYFVPFVRFVVKITI